MKATIKRTAINEELSNLVTVVPENIDKKMIRLKKGKELVVITKKIDASREYSESIIDTVREPLIVLDQDLRVVKVSRSFYEFFKVKPEDTVGQLIYNLGNKQWDIPKLRELLENILPQKTAFDNYEVEHDFTTIGRRIMLLNARQIEQGIGKERIILLAIEDITERKEIENGLEKTRKELVIIKKTADDVSEFAESLIDTVREPLIALDQDLRVVKVSRSFYEFFKVKPEDTVGQLIYNLGNKQWDIPKLRELLENILPQKTAFDNYEVEHDFTTIGRRIMLLNARQIEQGIGKERIILLAIEDITERKEIENGLEKTRKELVIIKKTADDVSEFAESLIDTVREPLIALDQDLRVVKVSRSFYEFFKVKSEDTVGQLIYDLGNKQWDIPKLRELLENILPQKTAFDNYEVEHDFTTIGRRIMLLNARQIEQGIGKERIILLAIEDITERKKLEEAHGKLAKIVEYADDAIIGEDLDGVILSWNKGAEALYGYKAGNIIGKSIALLMSPGSPAEYKEVMARIVLGETIKHYDTQRKRRNGEIVNVSLTISPVKDLSGKIIGVSTIARDITERKEIENGLEKTRKELVIIKKTADDVSEFAESLIDTVREPLIALDQDLRVVKVSRSFYEFFKVEPEDTVGQLIYDLGNKQWDIPGLRELLENILPQRTAFDNYEVEHDFSTIGRRIMLLNARQIERGIEKERIILLAIEDITERKEIENALKKAHEELESFAYSVSHDLRAPLRGIDGWSLALLEDYKDKLDEKGRGYIDLVRSETQIMGRLIDDLLMFSRQSRAEMNQQRLDLTTVAQAIVSRIQQQNPTIQADFIIQPGLMALGDNGLIEIALKNLIDNALKFSSKNAHSRIEFGRMDKDGEKAFFVRDNGVGFDMAYSNKLFGVFRRLHKASDFPGTGIGLASVQRIINRHGGRIWAEAKVNEGATFYFTLKEVL